MRLRRPWMIYGYRLGDLEIESSTGSRFLWPTKKHGLWEILGRYKHNFIKKTNTCEGSWGSVRPWVRSGRAERATL